MVIFMRYFSLLFFIFYSSHAFSAQQYLGQYCDGEPGCSIFTASINARNSSEFFGACALSDPKVNYACAPSYRRCPLPSVNHPSNPSLCVPVCVPPQILEITESGGTCIDPPDDGDPDECLPPNVKNINTGLCEPKTECVFPQLWDYYTNACVNNPNHCAIGCSANPLQPGECMCTGEPTCPAGWGLSATGSSCYPTGESSSTPSASAPATSAPTTSAQSGSDSSSGSNPGGGGGEDDGGNNNGGNTSASNSSYNGTGGGNGNGNGSASSTSSKGGSGGANGSAGAGNCDPTAHDYLACISRENEPGQNGDDEGIGDLEPGAYSLDIDQRLQDARDRYMQALNQKKQDFENSLSLNVSASGGGLPHKTVSLFGESVELGLAARTDFFDAIKWLFWAFATVLAIYIVFSK